MNSALKINEPAPAPTTGEFNTVLDSDFPPGDSNKRVIALLIDSIIVGASGKLLSTLAGTMLPPGLISANFGNFVGFFLMPIVYWIILTLKFGATPGKKIMGLRIVPIDPQKTKLSFDQLFLREVIGRPISTLAFFIAVPMHAFRKDRRTIHDFISSTRVIQFR